MPRKRIISVLTALTVVGLVMLLCGPDSSYAQHSPSFYEGVEKEPPLNLELGLKLYKHTYLVREPIRVRVSATNVGEYQGRLQFKTGDALAVRDSKGRSYRCQICIDRVGLDEIGPMETMEEEVNLSSFCFGVSHSKWGVFWYLPPEKYAISYCLGQTTASGETTRVESPIDTFEVLEPQGQDAEALKLLLRSYDLQLEKRDRESSEKLHQILQKYAQSGYVPYVMLMLANTVEKWTEIIRRFPDSGEAIAAVNSMAYHFTIEKDQAAYVQAMNELINQYADTDIARVASQLRGKSDRFFRERSKPDHRGQEDGG